MLKKKLEKHGYYYIKINIGWLSLAIVIGEDSRLTEILGRTTTLMTWSRIYKR